MSDKKNSFKRCKAIVSTTEQRCKAPSVLPNTFRTVTTKDEKTGKKKIIRTSIVNNPHYCQMHQPDKPVKCKCNCHKKELTFGRKKRNKNKKK